MSTISAQCDELRELAAKYDELKSGATRAVRISLDTGPVLREAADTICELRDSLHRERAEADMRIISLEAALEGMHLIRERDMAENAKLRELVRDMNKAAHMLCEAWEGSCSREAEGMSLHAVCPIGDTNELCVFGKLYDRAIELGVELDGDGTH